MKRDNTNYLRTLPKLTVDDQLVMAKSLLGRAIKLADRLTLKHKRPSALLAKDFDSDCLVNLRRAVERLEKANEPKVAGRKRGNLNALRSVSTRWPLPQGRKSDRRIDKDQRILCEYQDEKARQQGLGISIRSLDKFWLEWATHLGMSWAKANLQQVKGGQGLTAEQLKSERKHIAAFAKTRATEYRLARERLKKRRLRQSGTKPKK